MQYDMANTASPPTPLISNRSNKNKRKRLWESQTTRTSSDDESLMQTKSMSSSSKFNTHKHHGSKKKELNMKSNYATKATKTTKKKNRFDSSSSSEDESFEIRKQRIAIRKKISAKSYKKMNVPPNTTDCYTSGNDKVKESDMNRSALSHDENDVDDRSINRKVDTESHREDTSIEETEKKHSCLEEDKEEVAVSPTKQKMKKNNIPCIDLLDSDDSGDSHPKMDSGNRKKRHKRKPKSRGNDVDRESLIQRSKHLVTKTGTVLSNDSSSSSSDTIYAGMDPASRALIQKLQQEDEAAKSTSKIMGENDHSLARRMHAAERATTRTNGRESISSMEDLLQSLDRCQRGALVTVERQARIRHEAANPKVQKRISSLGYRTEDLDNCLAYIRNEAPIIIHLNEQCLSFLAAQRETHYRNLFEVNTSGGSPAHTPRRQWERSMFGSTYDRAKPFQRVKYGCLNSTGDIEGVAPARSYGQLFITLKQSVRHRCTFFNMDTASFSGGGSGLSALSGLAPVMGSYGAGGGGDTLATARNYCHILEKYSDAELHSILALNKIGGGQSKCMNYKEVQIHGPVCLATDIEALSIPGREVDASRDLMSKVERFQKKSNCTILWQADLLGHDSSRHGMAAGLCLMDCLMEWECRQIHLVLVPRMKLLLRSYRLLAVDMLLAVVVLVEVVRVRMEHQHLVVLVLVDIRLEGVTLRQHHHLPAVDTSLEALQDSQAVDSVLLLQLMEEVEEEVRDEVDLGEGNMVVFKFFKYRRVAQFSEGFTFKLQQRHTTPNTTITLFSVSY